MDNVHLEPHCAPCYNFVNDGLEQKQTVWIVPIIINNDEYRTKVSWACSLRQSCQNQNCVYAKGRRDKQLS